MSAGTPPQFIFSGALRERARSASSHHLPHLAGGGGGGGGSGGSSSHAPSRQSTRHHHNGPLHDLRRFLNTHLHPGGSSSASASRLNLDDHASTKSASRGGSPSGSGTGTPTQASTTPDYTDTASHPSHNHQHGGRGSPPLGEEHAHLQKKYGKWGKVLGSGAGGTVRLIKKSKEHTVYAVKEFRTRRNGETEKDYVKKVTAEFCVRHRPLLDLSGAGADESGRLARRSIIPT